MLELSLADVVTVPSGQPAHHQAGWVAWVVVGLIAVAVVAGKVWLTMAAHGRTDGGEDSDDGGGGLRRDDGVAPRPPQPPTTGTDPEWWPEFEHQFAAHVARHTPRARGEKERMAARPPP
jgi:hypothetical protein